MWMDLWPQDKNWHLIWGLTYSEYEGQIYDVTNKGFCETKCYSFWFKFILKRQSENKAERQKKKEGENEK